MHCRQPILLASWRRILGTHIANKKTNGKPRQNSSYVFLCVCGVVLDYAFFSDFAIQKRKRLETGKVRIHIIIIIIIIIETPLLEEANGKQACG